VSKKSLSAIPGVDTILDALDDIDCPRLLLLAIIREHLSSLRKAKSIPSFEQIAGDIRDRVAAFVRAAGARPASNANWRCSVVRSLQLSSTTMRRRWS